MPRAPLYDNLQVNQAPAPSARITASASPDAFGADIGEKGAAIGFEIYRQEMDRANEQAIFEARRKFNEWENQTLFDPEQGAVYKRGRDSFDLPEKLTDNFDKFTGEIEQNLSNDAQKRTFRRLAESRRQQVIEWTNRHVAREREVYYGQQFDADVEDMKDRAAIRPELASNEIGVMRSRIIGYYRDKGASEEVIAQELQKHESEAHSKVIEKHLANGQDLSASDYYDSVKSRIDPDIATRIDKALEVGKIRGESQRMADEILGRRMSPESQPEGSLMRAVIRAESGGRQFTKNGEPLTSPKGAVGIAQILPSTGPEAARLAGLPWDEERLRNDAEYNKALGEAYLQKQLNTYQNQTLALAAYNAGPGKVNEWIKRFGDPRKGEISINEFIQKIPFDETRDYVLKIQGTTRSQAQRPVALTVDQALEEVQKISDPRVRDATQERIVKHFSLQRQLENQRQEELALQATNIVEQSGGDTRRVPPAVWSQLPLSTRSALESYGKKLGEGTPIQTDWQTYYDLKSQASSPALVNKFLKTNLLNYRNKLDDGEFKELINVQVSLREKDGKANEQLDGYLTDSKIVSDALRSAGINPEATKGERAKQVSLFHRSVDQAFIQEQQQKGRKLTTDEKIQLVDKLMIRGGVEGTGFLGLFQDKRFAFELRPGEKLEVDPAHYDDIPVAEVRKITESLQRNGYPTTREAITQMYNRKLGAYGR